jgi:uncharacterized membrane protein
MENTAVKKLAFCGLFTAMTFIATFINIRLPIASYGGLIHLGSIVLVLSASMQETKYAAVSTALGMALFDLVGGWVLWAPATFIIRFIQVLILGSTVKRKGNHIGIIIIAYVLCSLWEMGGYYVAEAVIYGNWVAPLASMPSEILHNIIGIAGFPLAIHLKKLLHIETKI